MAAFFTLRKFLGPKQAVFFGALSYGGILWQTTLHNLLHHRMIVLALVCAAFAGFLLAYNYPPSKKGQMSFQMILQFVAGILVFIASPSLASEGCAIYLVFGTSWIYTSYVRPHLRPRRLGREDGRNSEEHDVAAQGGETMGFESPQGTDRGPTDAAAAGYVRHVAERWGKEATPVGAAQWAASSPAIVGRSLTGWATPTPKKRLTEKRCSPLPAVGRLWQ